MTLLSFCPSFSSAVQDPMAYEQLIKTAEDFIAKRALAHVGSIQPQPVVHIVKVCRAGCVWQIVRVFVE